MYGIHEFRVYVWNNGSDWLYAQVNKTHLVLHDHSPKIFQRNFKYRIRKKKKKYFNQSLLLRYIFLFVSFSLSDSDNMTEFQRLVYWKDSMLPKSTGLDSMVQL